MFTLNGPLLRLISGYLKSISIGAFAEASRSSL